MLFVFLPPKPHEDRQGSGARDATIIGLLAQHLAGNIWRGLGGNIWLVTFGWQQNIPQTFLQAKKPFEI